MRRSPSAPILQYPGQLTPSGDVLVARGKLQDGQALRLRVLPTLVDCLEAIPVRIVNVGCVIAGIIIQARAGLAVINRASLHRRVVEGIDLSLSLGDKADMGRPSVGLALSQPEE